MTAIAHPSGSGKLTIAKLMADFGGCHLRTVSFLVHRYSQHPPDQLMGEISYVAQDNFLFDKTIRDNIRMGNPDATNETNRNRCKSCKLP